MAQTLGIAKKNVRLVSPFIGGGFGGKLFLRADALLAALGARAARRPVKVALPRPLIINNTTHRPATIQRIRIGATEDGKITAIGHESWSGNLPGGDPETAVSQTRLLYAGANRMTAMRLADARPARRQRHARARRGAGHDGAGDRDRRDGRKARARSDRVSHPQRYPGRSRTSASGRSRSGSSIECLRVGADRFGWSKRNPQPGQTREGSWLIGIGVAAAFRNNLLAKSAARVRLDNRGMVTVETDMTDIGTGSYTIIAQTAAEMMGVPLKDVTVRLGDSAFPVSCGSGGQFGANNSTSGVYAACVKLREAVAQQAWLQFRRCGVRRRLRPLGQSQRPARRGGRRRRSFR